MREPGDLMRFRTLDWGGAPIEISARIVIEVRTPATGAATCVALSAAGTPAYRTFTYKELGCPVTRARHVKR